MTIVLRWIKKNYFLIQQSSKHKQKCAIWHKRGVFVFMKMVVLWLAFTASVHRFTCVWFRACWAHSTNSSWKYSLCLCIKFVYEVATGQPSSLLSLWVQLKIRKPQMLITNQFTAYWMKFLHLMVWVGSPGGTYFQLDLSCNFSLACCNLLKRLDHACCPMTSHNAVPATMITLLFEAW